MGGSDITEGLRSGASLTDLIRASETGDPLLVKARGSELADMGLDLLKRTLDEIMSAQGELEQGPMWSSLLDDEALVQLASAYKLKWHKYKAITLPYKDKRGINGKLNVIEEGICKLLEGQQQTHVGIGPLVRTLDEELSRLEAPKGYQVDHGGVFLKGETLDRNIAREPIVVSRAFRDVERGTERLTLSWKKQGKWQSTTVDRREALDGRMLVGLSSLGAPVGGDNSSEVAKYLREFESCNHDKLPREDCASHLGWMPDGSFLFPGMPGVKLVPRNAGEAALFAGWGDTAGTWEQWLDIIEEHVIDRPSVMLGVYAALVPPLLKLVSAEGFTIDWAGESTQGKTTTLKVAASVWGKPEKRTGVIQLWDSASEVGPSTIAACLHSLPVFLDDTQHMESPKQQAAVGNMLYAIPGGHERTRGTVEGSIRESRRWQTCMMTTGERPISSFAGATGARARTICLTGSPFPGDYLATKAEVELLNSKLSGCYGWLGRRMLENMPGAGLKQTYQDLCDDYAERVEGRLAGRITGYVALLHMAAEIAHDLGLPGTLQAPMSLAISAARRAGSDADRPTEALQEVVSHCATHRDQLFGVGGREPNTGWLAAWKQSGDDEEFAFEPMKIRELLERAGYQAANTLMSWKARGWLRGIEGSDRYTYPGKIAGRDAQLITVLVDARVRALIWPDGKEDEPADPIPY